MAQFEIPRISASDVNDALTDAFYVGVGFGVITFQKAQVRRRELTRRVSEQASEARQPIDRFGDDAEARLSDARSGLDDRLKLVEQRLESVEHRVDDVLDDVEGKLPPQARELVTQARSTAKGARTQVSSLVNRNGGSTTARTRTSAATRNNTTRTTNAA